MPRSAPLLASFNVGEISPRLYARTDFQKYAKALRQCLNFLPLVQGPVTKRPGTAFVTPVKIEGDNHPILLPFVFSADQAFVMEFGEHYIRFYRNYGLVTELPKTISGATRANPVVVTSAAHGLANGDGVYVYGVEGMHQINSRSFVIAGVTTNTFELTGIDGTSYGAYSAGGMAAKVVEVSTPYLLADLPQLQMVQSGDVIYIAHPNHQPHKLTRISNTQWNITTLTTLEGPFQKINADKAITVLASARTGTGITITAAGGNVFTADMVGSLFYIETKDAAGIPPWESDVTVSTGEIRRNDGKYYLGTVLGGDTGTVAPVHTEGSFPDRGASSGGVPRGVSWQFLHAGYGWVRITSYVSATEVIGDVISDLPDSVAPAARDGDSSVPTYRWAKAAWHSGNWPACVTLHDQRLVFAGTHRQPDTIWHSVVGDYENFAARDRGGRVVADQAVTITLASSQFNAIRWLSSDSKGLLVGTGGSEHIVTTIAGSDPFGPGNAKAVTQSNWGSADLQAVPAGGAKLMLQRSRRKLRELVYNFDSDRYQSPDLILLADHMTESATIAALAWQQEPHAVLWCARSDGVLLGFTYNREQDVAGWHRHQLGGKAIVESVCCIPSPDGGRDDLWLIARRTINGQVRRYVEYLKPCQANQPTLADSYFVDCGLTREEGLVTTLTGLEYLEGMDVAILADGAVVPGPNIVTGGAITLPDAASVIHVGLPYQAKLQTLRLDAGAADGTAQGKVKRINEVVVRLEYSLGGRYGATDATTLPFHFRGNTHPMGTASTPFTGDYPVTWPGGYDRDDGITIVQEDPLPFTVIALMPRLTTQDR